MPSLYPVYHPEFYTATILEWKHLLKPDKYKDIVIETLRFLVTGERIRLFGFVIMSNHLHLIWQPLGEYLPKEIQHSFMTRTGQQIKLDLEKNHPAVLSRFKVKAKDRQYQFWERNSLGIELYTHEVFIQKLDYIHYNPVRAGLCQLPEEYHYSSAKFYYTGVDEFGILSHYNG
jgi:putative transposase